ncbi:LacI family DNA-binding transcriptional regulator [Clavibacter michiganensis]|uniref:LacI family DNA-binding transcriptional regulator n=1 Tax=Clavibacter michiganensis TaxID=28447 RepID=UPI000A3A1B81|nr:LacI family DNA-binding transcriptional regulator [Clavibacter michiganensis]OUD88801.1 Catabolite control protein A [Clavibacter michiganensis subsp. michiganensis]OUE13153.1 Catabolite control protein A [Clavibacter michiganensis subsp. michiganensis]
MARVTSKDVARAAGVSQATVSFVMNGRHLNRITDQTRDVVLRAAGELGYVPSASGRTLKAGRSNVVTCIVPDMRPSEAVEVFKRALSGALADSGYACVFIHPTGGLNAADLWKYLEPCAVVGLDKIGTEDAQTLRNGGTPVVDGLLLSGAAQIIDQHKIGELQVRHLAAQGHRRIAFAAVDDASEDIVSEQRVNGALDAARQLGLPEPRITRMGYTAAAARDSVRDLVFGAEPVTAVAVFSDVLALALIAAAQDQSITVPRDLAVIGVDNIQLAALSVPSLTTVSMDLSGAAQALARHLSHLIQTPGESPPAFRAGALNVIERQTA